MRGAVGGVAGEPAGPGVIHGSAPPWPPPLTRTPRGAPSDRTAVGSRKTRYLLAVPTPPTRPGGRGTTEAPEDQPRNWWKTVGSESRCWMQLIAPGDRRAVDLTRGHDDHRLRSLRRGPTAA